MDRAPSNLRKGDARRGLARDQIHGFCALHDVDDLWNFFRQREPPDVNLGAVMSRPTICWAPQCMWSLFGVAKGFREHQERLIDR